MLEKYYVWSYEHNAWWKRNRTGYTYDLREAGTYKLSDALRILRIANIAGEVNEAIVSTDAFQSFV